VTLILRILFFVASVSLAHAADPGGFTLRAGAARADITPEPEVLNWVTGKPYDAVLDPLNVHALVLDDGRSKAVVIRWDLVDVSESARDEVRRVVGGALGVPGDNIMVHASHTHSAPWAPVYGGGHRGKERDTWWAVRHMPPQNDHPPFKRWMERLLTASVDASKRAAASAAPASVWIGRIAVNEFLHNRRPRAPGWGLADAKPSPPINYNHPDWNPEVLQGGATFGPMDRTLSLVAFRNADGQSLASLFHVACHAVSIYPSNPGISADWPGAASGALAAALGGEALFLQGCAGDINPWRRGAAAVADMAQGFAKKAEAAMRFSVRLAAAPLQSGRATVHLPLTAAGKARIGADSVAAEIQVITCGPLALVALPGEPMTELGTTIRERSPFPQTLVLGYANGNGAHYVGMPGEKARGGYEAGVAGAGTDECGLLMVDAAAQLLREMFERAPRPPAR
jgi:neutral ceramidase